MWNGLRRHGIFVSALNHFQDYPRLEALWLEWEEVSAKAMRYIRYLFVTNASKQLT